jgi:predicted RNase H-like HicB family nuclease
MSESKPTIEFKIDIIIEPDDNGFHAYCPALKGLHTSGDTREAALENARYAAIAYLESLIKHNDPIPVGITVKTKDTGKENITRRNVNHYTEDVKVACTI